MCIVRKSSPGAASPVGANERYAGKVTHHHSLEIGKPFQKQRAGVFLCRFSNPMGVGQIGSVGKAMMRSSRPPRRGGSAGRLEPPERNTTGLAFGAEFPKRAVLVSRHDSLN